MAFGGPDAVGETSKNFQERGAEAGFRLCEGHCGVHDCRDEIRKIWRVERGFGTAKKFQRDGGGIKRGVGDKVEAAVF